MFAHDGGSDLAESYAMSPAGSVYDEPLGYSVLYIFSLYDESRAV